MLTRQQVIWVCIAVVILFVASTAVIYFTQNAVDPAGNAKTQENKSSSKAESGSVKTTGSNSAKSAERTSPDADTLKATSPAEQFPEHVWWLSMVVIFMSIATVIAVAVSFYLYRWRKILLEAPSIAVPEEWSSWYKEMTEAVNKFGSNVNNIGSIVVKRSDSTATSLDSFSKSLIKNSKSTEAAINDMTETLMTLTGSLDEKDKEIRRLKKGYDGEIFKKFLRRFIRVNQVIEEYQNENTISEEAFEDVRGLLEDALQQCDVERFEPELMSDYREAFGVADNPKTINTNNEEENSKIVEVLERGYQYNGPEGPEELTPAKVQIYQFVEKEGEKNV